MRLATKNFAFPQFFTSSEPYSCSLSVRALQLPPEAWIRMSLANGSITRLTIRPNGIVSLASLGDSGHFPKEKITFS